MSALMRQNFRHLRTLAGCVMLVGLAACEHYAPNSRPERDSTEAITRAQSERLQSTGAGRVMPPSQIRIPTRTRQSEDGECRDWLDTCWEEEAGRAPAVSQENVPSLARMSRPADAQTFRGMLPCLAGASSCGGQRAVLTLSADRSWQARVSHVAPDGSTGASSLLRGCWLRGAQDPRHLALYLANGNLFTELQATSGNNLLVVGANDSSLRYTLTRQPEADTLQPGAPACPAA